MNPNDEREYTDYDMPQIEEYGDEDREYTHPEEYVDDEPTDMTDVEADADTLASAGWGTDEDYGYYGDDGY